MVRGLVEGRMRQGVRGTRCCHFGRYKGAHPLPAVKSVFSGVCHSPCLKQSMMGQLIIPTSLFFLVFSPHLFFFVFLLHLFCFVFYSYLFFFLIFYLHLIYLLRHSQPFRLHESPPLLVHRSQSGLPLSRPAGDTLIRLKGIYNF
jgi:hypothetical protein